MYIFVTFFVFVLSDYWNTLFRDNDYLSIQLIYIFNVIVNSSLLFFHFYLACKDQFDLCKFFKDECSVRRDVRLVCPITCGIQCSKYYYTVLFCWNKLFQKNIIPMLRIFIVLELTPGFPVEFIIKLITIKISHFFPLSPWKSILSSIFSIQPPLDFSGKGQMFVDYHGILSFKHLQVWHPWIFESKFLSVWLNMYFFLQL